MASHYHISDKWAVEHAKGEDGEQRYLCGDQAYDMLPAIISPFRRNLVDREHKVFNYLMSKYCTTVEWGIGMISMQWPRFQDKQYQRTGLTPVGTDWRVATLLWNVRTCLVGNQISMSMGCNPPMLEQYFSSPCVWEATVSPDPTVPKSGVNSQQHANDNKELMVNKAL